MSISMGALVLAGGASRRFGSSKLLHRVNGCSLLELAIAAPLAVGIRDVVVVTGAWHHQLQPVLSSLPVRVVPNPDWAEGMSTSLRTGLSAFDPLPQAVLICLGDQPGLPATVIERLIEEYRRTGSLIVAPAVQGKRQNPVLFDRQLVPELLTVTGDSGGREVIRRHTEHLHLVPFTDLDWFRDVDTPGDLEGM